MTKNSMITVIGSSNTDFSVKVDSLPKRGQTVLGRGFMVASGGKGANQAVQAARLGADVTFVARVGRDYFGGENIRNFKKAGINTDYIARDKAHPSGAAIIFVDKEGNNQIAVAPNSNEFLNLADVIRAVNVIKHSSVLLLQLEVSLKTVEKALWIAAKNGVKTILNPAPFKKLSKELLRKIDILVPNETEAQSLTGVRVRDADSAFKAGKIILKSGPRSVIVTLGCLGCVIVEESGGEYLPAPKVKAVDATAAGDSFCGALAVSIAEGKGLRDAVDFANHCAAISVTRAGAQPSLPTKKKVFNFIKKFPLRNK